MNKIVIAIDGFSSCGKSTLAKELAMDMGYVFIDSGAMYRAATLFFITHQIDIKSVVDVNSALENMSIGFKNIEGSNTIFLNDKNVEDAIRKPEISDHVSAVAAIPAVREKMVKLQKSYGLQKGIVMDGRDIGTVVFPTAEVKFFVTASLEVRAQRRFLELKEKGIEIGHDEVVQNLQERDYIDTTRAHSPLRKAADAITIDNTWLNRTEQLQLAKAYIAHYNSQQIK